jgi:hypothetical protein
VRERWRTRKQRRDKSCHLLRCRPKTPNILQDDQTHTAVSIKMSALTEKRKDAEGLFKAELMYSECYTDDNKQSER